MLLEGREGEVWLFYKNLRVQNDQETIGVQNSDTTQRKTKIHVNIPDMKIWT